MLASLPGNGTRLNELVKIRKLDGFRLEEFLLLLWLLLFLWFLWLEIDGLQILGFKLQVNKSREPVKVGRAGEGGNGFVRGFRQEGQQRQNHDEGGRITLT